MPTETTPTIALIELPPRRCAAVAALELDQASIDRLAGLGVCVGRQVELLQHGDPMIIRACGARIGLARELGRGIRVVACDMVCAEPIAAAPSADGGAA
jgi:Fe2+ transport system protein FeoA